MYVYIYTTKSQLQIPENYEMFVNQGDATVSGWKFAQKNKRQLIICVPIIIILK